MYMLTCYMYMHNMCMCMDHVHGQVSDSKVRYSSGLCDGDMTHLRPGSWEVVQ